NPRFWTANSGRRPVTNTAEHTILAKPAAWCSRGSPGGGTYGVLSSRDRARAISGLCAGAGIAVRSHAAGMRPRFIQIAASLALENAWEPLILRTYVSCAPPTPGRPRVRTKQATTGPTPGRPPGA